MTAHETTSVEKETELVRLLRNQSTDSTPTARPSLRMCVLRVVGV